MVPGGSLYHVDKECRPNTGKVSLLAYSSNELPFFFFGANSFMAFFHPPLSLRLVLAACTAAAPLTWLIPPVPRSLVGGVVGGVMAGSCSAPGGLSGPPLLSVNALSEIADECDRWVDRREPLCRLSAVDSADDCVEVRCCGGDRDGSKDTADVFGGERRGREGM